MKNTVRLSALPPAVQVLVGWFLTAHGAIGTVYRMERHDTNRGLALLFAWSETVWAWVWVESPVQYVCGWPEGAEELEKPYVCRHLVKHVADFREVACA